MLAIPSGDTQTSSVLALAVVVASWITKFGITQLTVPAFITLAFVVDAVAMRPTTQVTKLQRTIIAAKLSIANAFLGVHVEFSMARAGGQARYSGLVFNCAVRACPTLLADATSFSAETMARAGRVGAVNFFTKSSFEASGA